MPVQPSGFIAEEANPQFKEAQVGAFSPVGMKWGEGRSILERSQISCVKSLLLKMWSLDQHHQYQLGTHLKCKVDQLNQNLYFEQDSQVSQFAIKFEQCPCKSLLPVSRGVDRGMESTRKNGVLASIFTGQR